MKTRVAGAALTMSIMWISHFLVDAMIGFWSVFKTIEGVDLAIAGLIAGICPFIGEGMQLLFGSIGDRGYRKILLLFGLLTTAASVLFPYFHQASAFFVIFLITCIGSGAFHPTAVAITSSLTHHRKGLFVTIFASGGALGLAFSHLIFTSWHKHLNYSPLWLATPTILLILFTSLFSIHGASHKPAQPGRRYGFAALKRLFECKELKILYFSLVCVQSIFWGTIFLLPDVLQSKGYPEWICFGFGHFAFIIGGAFMMIPGGYLSDRFSARSVLLISNSFGCVVFYLFLMSPQLSEYAILLLLLMVGASLGIASPVSLALGNRIMPSRPGLVSAFLMGMVWCISEWLGPGGGGLLTKLFSSNGPVMSLSILGVLFFGGTVLTALLPTEIEQEFELDAA